jgi:hypothetical protein
VLWKSQTSQQREHEIEAAFEGASTNDFGAVFAAVTLSADLHVVNGKRFNGDWEINPLKTDETAHDPSSSPRP